MNLSEISIRRPVLAWMLMGALIILGGICFMRMPVSQLPDVDFPVVTVSASLEGAAPEVMETDVVDAIENAVMTVQGVQSITSVARQGSASISIEFDLDRNIDLAVQEVQTKIAQAQRNLPTDLDPVTVNKTNPEDQPIMWLTVRSDKYPTKDIMAYVRDYVRDRFTTLPGVGDVLLGGYIEPNLRVWVSNEGLKKYSLTVTDVLNTVRNEHLELPAGRIETATKELNVRMMGEAKSVEDFSQMIISTRGGMPNYAPIPLKEVVRVEEGLADLRRLSRSMGLPAVGLGIRKQRGSNAVEVSHAVKKRLAEVQKTLPEGMQIAVNFDGTKFIEESIGELNFTLVLSALLTALVCWGFLGSWSSTVNVVLAIPTAIVGTFIVLYFSGFTLNTFTLLGLSLAIGIVVDDAIMVLENIVRHYENGKDRVDAALTGSKEIYFAALAATIAIVAIFLPVAFVKGIIGKFFYQFSVTMTVAVLLSLLEALTLTPMRCSQFLSVGERRTRIGKAIEHSFERMNGWYRRVLEVTLNHRLKVIAGSLVFFFLTLVSVKFLNKEFMPAQDQGRFMVRIQTPVGSSLQFTDAKFKEAEKFFASHPDVDRYYTAVGGFGGGQVNSGIVFITLKERPERKLSQHELMDVTRKELAKIPDAKVFLQDLSMRGFTASRGFPVEFTVRGPDWEKLGGHSQEIMKRLEATGLVSDLDSDYETGMPEVQITPDRRKAALRGVSVRAISETVNALVGGVIVGKYPKGGHRYDVRVSLTPDQRASSDQLKDLYVRNNRGELIRLSDVVKIDQKPTLQVIGRRDRERAITVFANVATGKSQSQALEKVEAIAKEVLPEGYRAVLSGSSQTFRESGQSLLFVLLLGILVSYMVLASQFNSFIDPVVVLMALPFSVSGAFLALLIAGQSINIYSLIGLVLLMGIVKKNSILLVDFTNQLRDQGVGLRSALLEACPVRLRPILMTSFATIAGAVPPALAIGPGAETRIPMAVAVIGGVLVSTLLTLVVVPCVYSLVARERRAKVV
ncbi:MAG: efflux RND transporter permease subunit [Bdellovibrionota bacterium]